MSDRPTAAATPLADSPPPAVAAASRLKVEPLAPAGPCETALSCVTGGHGAASTELAGATPMEAATPREGGAGDKVQRGQGLKRRLTAPIPPRNDRPF